MKYSQRDDNMIDTKIMKQCVLCGISVLILEAICISLQMTNQSTTPILIIPILICMPIISSFDIVYCNANNNQNQNVLGLSMANQQYLQNVMAEFYRNPIRNLESEPRMQAEEH